MKLLLDIKDQRVPFVLEMLKGFKFIKMEELTPHKIKVLESLEEEKGVKLAKVAG